MELSDYLRVLRNHWTGVLAIIVSTLIVAAGYSWAQDEVYAADANAFVSAGGSTDPALSSVSDSLAKSRAKSYVDIAKSRATAQAAIDELGLDVSPAGLIGQITAEQPPDTVLIKITARADSPQAAQDLADAWIRALAKQVASIENPKGTNERAIAIVPIEAAALPTSPVSPNIPRNLSLGLAVGIVLAFAYAMIRSQFDRKLRTAADVERVSGVAVVASIPKTPSLARHDDGRTGIAVLASGEGGDAHSAGEAFRKLRTNLQFMDVDNPPKIIVVTSPQPGDGKSTTAANLAAAIASSGESVVLVDCDLRRPTVADSFGMVEGAGLTDVLAGRVQVAEVLQQHPDLENLSVLAAGAIPPNPSELLGSMATRRLLVDLAESGTVIIDTPPLLPVTDGAVLTTVSDGAFVVISAGQTLDTELASALEHVRTVHGRALGVILNGAAARDVYTSNYYYQPESSRGPRKSGNRGSSSRSKGKRVASS